MFNCKKGILFKSTFSKKSIPIYNQQFLFLSIWLKNQYLFRLVVGAGPDTLLGLKNTGPSDGVGAVLAGADNTLFVSISSEGAAIGAGMGAAMGINSSLGGGRLLLLKAGLDWLFLKTSTRPKAPRFLLRPAEYLLAPGIAGGGARLPPAPKVGGAAKGAAAGGASKLAVELLRDSSMSDGGAELAIESYKNEILSLSK